MHLRQLENADVVDLFKNELRMKMNITLNILFEIASYNPHRKDDSFENKIKVIKRDVLEKALDLTDLIAVKKIELLNKGLSSERIQKFLQFEADESHVGDQCQVCLQEFEVERLMKQLDCGGRHSFCSGCIDQWFANHKTCPICRHIFV